MDTARIAYKIAQGMRGGFVTLVGALWSVMPASWRGAASIVLACAAAILAANFAPGLKTFSDDAPMRRLFSIGANLVSAFAVSTAAFLGVVVWQWQTAGPIVTKWDPAFAEAAEAAGLSTSFSGDTCTDQILATISAMESGGDASAQNDHASASGLYQMIDSTWLGLGGDTYAPTAKEASAAEQTIIARKHVDQILDVNGGDVSAVPVVWYWPDALGDPAKMAMIPPWPGNKSTVAEYQASWLAELPRHGSACDDTATAGTALAVVGSANLALPLPGPVQPKWVDAHHNYPATDIGAETGTPIYAMAGGTVVRTLDDPTHCYNPGDLSDVSGCPVDDNGKPMLCGIGVTIESADGVRWSYCHMVQRMTDVGAVVAAGQQIGEVGDTGHSSDPHLHLGIKVGDAWACPAAAIEAAERGEWVDPTQLATSGCTN